MSPAVPAPVRAVLDQGHFCHVATMTELGPHVTPMVFATAGDRVWVTTSRGSVKARAWAEDARVAGLVRAGARAVSFAGAVTTFDLLEPGTWGRSLREGPRIALASARFTRKNARFFAGYAVDAHHVPFAWTPPGRVFAELTLERAVVFEDDAVVAVWGDWGGETPTAPAFRAVRRGPSAFDGLPADVRDRLGERGPAALGLSAPDGPLVLPARWLLDGAAAYAALPEETLALAGLPEPEAPAAIQVDHASWWRARAMIGAMVRGTAQVAVVERLSSGGRSAAGIAASAGLEPSTAALVRVRPERLVWWRGWSSGTSVVA